MNDGDSEDELKNALSDINDDRLIIFNLPQNRGRYFIDAVSSQACISQWWIPHDADDWSESHRVASLINRATTQTDAVFTPFINHHLNGIKHHRPIRRFRRSIYKREYVTHMSQLWRPEFARAFSHPGMRVSWDGFATSAALLTGKVIILNQPSYHRVYRKNSLVTSKETGVGSKLRRQQRQRQAVMWRDAVRKYRAYGNDPTVISNIIANNVSQQIKDEVNELAIDLRNVLESR